MTTIIEIRQPKKSAVFIKNQINQLVTETQQIKKQLEATNNAQMDTSIEREAETIDISAEAVGTQHRS